MTTGDNITVCTVTLNSADTLGATIVSVQEQSKSGIVHVIKDGGSTDNTAEIALRHKNVKFISKKDSGIYDAMNQVLAEVNTEYVHFLNSDDCYASADLSEYVIEKMNKEKLDVLFCGIQMVDENDKVVRKWAMSRLNILQRLGIVQAPHPGMFMRRDVFDRLNYRFSTCYKISSDYELQYLIVNCHNLRWERSNIMAVNMRTGGKSSRSAFAVFLGLKECVDILRKRKVKFPRLRVLLKFTSKIPQLF